MHGYLHALKKRISAIRTVIKEEISDEEWTQKIVYVNYKPQLIKRKPKEEKKDYLLVRKLCRMLRVEISSPSLIILTVAIVSITLFATLYIKNQDTFFLTAPVLVGKYTDFSRISAFGFRIQPRFGEGLNVDYGKAKLYDRTGKEVNESQFRIGDVLSVEVDSIETGGYAVKKITNLGPDGSLIEPLTNICPKYGIDVKDGETVQIQGEVSYADYQQFNIRTPEDHLISLAGNPEFKQLKPKYADCLVVTLQSAKVVSIRDQNPIFQLGNLLRTQLFKKEPKPEYVINHNPLPEWYTVLFPANVSVNPPRNSGVCIVRGPQGATPLAYAPAVGEGYAKMFKNGINTLPALQSACTEADYEDLMKLYCSRNKEQAQAGVVTYKQDGSVESGSGGATYKLFTCQ